MLEFLIFLIDLSCVYSEIQSLSTISWLVYV